MEYRRCLPIVLTALCVLGAFLFGEADIFYHKALAEGKVLFQEGNYEAALSNFKIAEFGLMEEHETLKELYFFYALSLYKLGKFEEAREIIKKFERHLNIEDVKSLTPPASVETDVKVMLATLLGDSQEGEEKKDYRLIKSFEIVFQDTLRHLEENRFSEARQGIKKLSRIDKGDPRVDYLVGILHFKQREYTESIDSLRDIYDAIGAEFRDAVGYYLVLGFYFEKNYGQALAFYQKIGNGEDKKKLNPIIAKIVAERESIISQISAHFDKGKLREAIESFPGDRFFCADILKSVLGKNGQNSGVIEEIIDDCLGYPGNLNQEFFLLAADTLDGMEKTKAAVRLIEKSPFVKSKEPDHIEIHYRLGRLYYKMGSHKKALKQFLLVNDMQEGYKEVKVFIHKIENRS
jgi:tetratricopeptide (TPR) repeat protein